MSLPLSSELGAVLDDAQERAERASQPASSAHLLLALFSVPNRAAVFLEDRDITVGTIQQKTDDLGPKAVEAPMILERVYARGERIAMGSRADAVGCLHILAALVRESSSLAVKFLKENGVNVSAIRASVMSYATGSTPLPRRLRSVDSSAVHATRSFDNKPAAKMREDAPSSIGFHPSLGVRAPRQMQTSVETTTAQEFESRGPEAPTPIRSQPIKPRFGRDSATRATRGPRRPSSSARTSRPVDARKTETPAPPEKDIAPTPKPRITPRADTPPKPAKPVAPIRKPAAKVTPKPAAKPAPKPTPEATPEAPEETPRAKTNPNAAAAIADAQETTRNLAERLFGKLDAPKTTAPTDDACTDEVDNLDEPSEAAPVVARKVSKKKKPAADKAAGVDGIRLEDPLEPNEDLAASYELDKDQYPNLVKFGRNITAQAARGRVDRVVGRDAEILQLIDVLGKRRSNNPVLVGEAGVGKTAIVEGLSREFVKLAQDGNRLGKRAIIELELGRILSGTHLRGSFSERLIGIKDEVEAAGGDVIVFLDEMHSWMTAGGGGDGTDAAGELKTALARGRFPCIGATTHDEFRKFVESDPAFVRRFQLVFVDEPDIDTARHIADGIRGHYEKHHGVRYDDAALDAAVRLSHRYIYQRRLPDKAIGVLDLAGSRAARTGESLVGRELVAEIVAEMAGIPPGRLSQGDRQRFLDMETHLQDGVIGHREVIGTLSDLIRRNYAGFRGRRPIGSLLFLGPTGVGKTEMVKVLADFLFHDRDAVVRLDMSEFMEAHSVSRMLGAPPGYVGHEQGGQLTEAVRRRPYQIVLLDEIEKAHPDVLNILLQLFDEGQLTDGRSRNVNFSNTVIIMTSNLGAEVFSEQNARASRGRIGFGGDSASSSGDKSRKMTDDVLGAARGHFRPELWNRIDEKLVFLPLERDEIASIAKLQLEDSKSRLFDESGITLEFSPSIIDFLIDHGGFDPELGARPMRQTIQRLIEGAVARLILSGEVTRGGAMRVEIKDDEVVCIKSETA
ncbi:AAA family ATPase [Bradymonas sediminis]|nr:AAA family ATPase [Bradymonas sediminis]TDP62968.1 ATP-dependent Clp protease ATP-binding subunit ClpA [Bradymonas sediminis]